MLVIVLEYMASELQGKQLVHLTLTNPEVTLIVSTILMPPLSQIWRISIGLDLGRTISVKTAE